MTPLRIGTRGSQLALWQARAVAARLEAAGRPSDLVVLTTAGDRLQRAPLSEPGTKGLFVKELEEALLTGAIDLAVHSAKDMSSTLPDGLAIAAALPRADPRDALVLPSGRRLADVAEAAAPHIGTSSVRRAAQLAAWLPRAAFSPIRGNVDSRLRKLDDGQFDALVLASAGLDRLGLSARATERLPIERCVPSPGQGIVAVEIRGEDTATRAAVAPLDDEDAAVALAAERAVVAALGGGCQLPLGAFAWRQGDGLAIRGVVLSADGTRIVAREARGSWHDPAGMGLRLADDLVRGGAAPILEAARR